MQPREMRLPVEGVSVLDAGADKGEVMLTEGVILTADCVSRAGEVEG